MFSTTEMWISEGCTRFIATKNWRKEQSSQESVLFVYDMCTSLCTISWLNFCVVQRFTLPKVYFPSSTSPVLFLRYSSTSYRAEHKTPPRHHRRCGLYCKIRHYSLPLFYKAKNISIREQNNFYPRIEIVPLASRNISDREQKNT